jgi:N-alpha-acetyltransferase 15/16, NatA auxiliary subunit
LKAALALDPTNPQVHEQLVHFRHVINSKLASLPPKVQEVIKSEFTTLDASADLKKYNADFQAKHKDSAPHVISAVKTKKLLGEDSSKVEKELAEVLSVKDVQFEQAIEVLDLLRGWRSKEVDGFKKAAAGKWPEVTAFA